MRKGLVMEGGALRGLFTTGIIDVFMENGIEFDGAIGVSAGAAFGCNYKSRQIGRGIRYNKNLARDWRYKSYRSFITTGDLFGGEFCYHTMPKSVDLFDTDVFESNPMEFYAVCTDVESGKPHYQKLTKGDDYDCEWIRASASMPLASKLVNIDGRVYLDGGITDSIPLKFMEDAGYDRNIVITTQPLGYTKKPYKIMPVIKAKYHKYPNMVHAIATRHNMYNAQTSYIMEREKAGACFVIRPPEALNIKPMERDTAEMDRVYDMGRIAGKKYLEDVKNFFG